MNRRTWLRSGLALAAVALLGGSVQTSVCQEGTTCINGIVPGELYE